MPPICGKGLDVFVGLPEQQAADRVATLDAVEQGEHLVGQPHERPLEHGHPHPPAHHVVENLVHQLDGRVRPDFRLLKHARQSPTRPVDHREQLPQLVQHLVAQLREVVLESSATWSTKTSLRHLAATLLEPDLELGVGARLHIEAAQVVDVFGPRVKDGLPDPEGHVILHRTPAQHAHLGHAVRLLHLLTSGVPVAVPSGCAVAVEKDARPATAFRRRCARVPRYPAVAVPPAVAEPQPAVLWSSASMIR